MPVVHFAHVGLNCQDLRTIERFYTRYFGFTRARVISLGTEEIIFLKSGHVYLELFQAKETTPEPVYQKDGPPYVGHRHIAFQVDDLEAMLKSLGPEVEITLGPLGFDDFIPGWRTVWIKDPDGRIVEISQGFQDQENPPALG